jgi:hypothetical protein
VRGLVRRYVQDRDQGTALRALWNRMQQDAEEAGNGPEVVEDAIQAVRENSSADESQDESPPAGDRP